MDPSARTAAIRLYEWLRRMWRSRAALSNTKYWLLCRGVPMCLVALAIMGTNAGVMGWSKTYEVLVGLTAPSGLPYPALVWPLSVLGWLMVPAFACRPDY